MSSLNNNEISSFFPLFRLKFEKKVLNLCRSFVEVRHQVQ